MPQASGEVLDKWPYDDGTAIALLSKNFNETGGVFSKKNADYFMTEKEYWAIRYLIEEWDYGYQ